MDIRFSNRWGGFDYWELYRILDGLIAMSYKPDYSDKELTDMIHEINQEMIKRKKEGGGL